MAECIRERYDALDGLRTVACIGIVLMHVEANSSLMLEGFAGSRLIPAFTDFVFLFMMLSAFGLCCGYLERALGNQLDYGAFYRKRYGKILPFFALLIAMDVLLSHSAEALVEGLTELTLLFGYLPGERTVIGVGWFLGLIFQFYLIFPFYCQLLRTKKSAWAALAAAVVLNWFASKFFQVNRRNLIYSLCYLVGGGVLYLYRQELTQMSRNHRWLCLAAAVLAAAGYFLLKLRAVMILILSACMIVYAMGRKGGLLDNRFTRFFSGISMEVYLCHMMIFRILEKVGLTEMFGSGWLQFLLTGVLTLGGAVVFSVFVQKGLAAAAVLWKRKRT